MHAVYQQGHSIIDIVQTINKILMGMEEIPREKLFEMIKLITMLKKRVLEGLTSEMQIAQFLAKCATLWCHLIHSTE